METTQQLLEQEIKRLKQKIAFLNSELERVKEERLMLINRLYSDI